MKFQRLGRGKRCLGFDRVMDRGLIEQAGVQYSAEGHLL